MWTTGHTLNNPQTFSVSIYSRIKDLGCFIQSLVLNVLSPRLNLCTHLFLEVQLEPPAASSLGIFTWTPFRHPKINRSQTRFLLFPQNLLFLQWSQFSQWQLHPSRFSGQNLGVLFNSSLSLIPLIQSTNKACLLCLQDNIQDLALLTTPVLLPWPITSQ